MALYKMFAMCMKKKVEVNERIILTHTIQHMSQVCCRLYVALDNEARAYVMHQNKNGEISL
jgi:hypothetical protein